MKSPQTKKLIRKQKLWRKILYILIRRCPITDGNLNDSFLLKQHRNLI